MSNSSSLAEFDTFGELLRHLRKRARLTQRDLGLAVGYSETHITRLENGQRLPDLTMVKGQFVEALDLKHEPALAKRLVALAAKTRGEAAPMGEQEPRESKRVRTNLPAQLTSFVGREREIAEVKELLGTTRLLTLIGAGGVGKTRLAQETAAGLLDTFPQGVWYVELAALADSALVPLTIAATLKLIERPDRLPLDAIADHFDAKSALLILDNCEHLIATCADLAVHLLERCPRLSILATSRETLRVPGETVYRIPSLTVPPLAYDTIDLSEYESVRLFIERAHAAQPALGLTPTNAADVAQICRQLDGIPLALELAAARLASLTPRQIAERLDDRLNLLTTGARTALPRQQTLRATIAWSVDLLTQPERDLLARLAVFTSGFTAEAAEAVFEQPNTLDGLSNLVEKSLVIADVRGDQARYRMLETIRQYAHERLRESGDVEPIRDRHLRYFLQLAERAEPELRRADQVAWLDRLEMELDNIRAAMAWSLEGERHVEAGLQLGAALMWLWHIRGHRREGSNWLERALAAEKRVRHASPRSQAYTLAHAEALNAAGFLMGAQRHHEKQVTLAGQGLALSRELGGGKKRSAAFALWILADAAYDQQNYDRAQPLFEESLALYQEVGDPFGVAECLRALGCIAHAVGDNRRAREMIEESLALRKEIGDKDGMALTYRRLSLLALQQGDLIQAAVLSRESLALFEEVRNKWGVIHALTLLERLTLVQGDHKEAFRLADQALALAQHVGDKYSTAASHYSLGKVAWSQGDYGQAATHHQEGLTWIREVGHKGGIADALCGLGDVSLAQGEHELAANRFEEVLTMGRDMEEGKFTIAKALFGLGRVAQVRNDYASAHSLHKEALALLRGPHEQWPIADALDALAAVASAQGQVQRATRLFGATETLYTQMRFTLSPFERNLHERAVAAVRSQLDETTFSAAWAEGKQMTLEQAVEFALTTEDSKTEHTELTPTGV